jgi:ABC-type uncharacterized transport system permease subunit
MMVDGLPPWAAAPLLATAFFLFFGVRALTDVNFFGEQFAETGNPALWRQIFGLIAIGCGLVWPLDMLFDWINRS